MKYKKILLSFIPFAVTITALCFLSYVIVQQNYRQSANDPQIQLVEDMAQTLQNNSQVQLRVSNHPVDIRNSLAPFLMVFDAKGKILASNGQIDGKDPILPSGVFPYVQKHKEERLTWEPKNNVRLAAIVKKYNGKHSGFVVAARSLREIEKRENDLTQIIVLAWIFTLLGCFISIEAVKRMS